MEGEAVASASTPSLVPTETRQASCQVCSGEISKYTCPGCSAKICSLDCTKAHKLSTGCSGQLQSTKYISMDGYGDVAMWRDLRFLREVGEKVKAVGGDLVLRERAASNNSAGRRDDGKGKGREREPNVTKESLEAYSHNDRMAQLSFKEAQFRKSLGSKGIELLYLPNAMEKHRLNKSGYHPKQRKLLMTVTISVFNGEGQKIYTKTIHHQELSSSLSSILQSALSAESPLASDDVKPAEHTMLLAVPMRPSMYVPRNAEPIVPARQEGKPKEAEKPLAAPHPSLPLRPAWAAEETEEAARAAAGISDDTLHKKAIPSTMARKAWRVGSDSSLSCTLEEALRGTAILEWPELEIYPRSYVQQMVKDDKLEFEARRPWDPDRSLKRKREDDAHRAEASTAIDKGVAEDSDSGSDSETTSSSSSSSSDSDDSDVSGAADGSQAMKSGIAVSNK